MKFFKAVLFGTIGGIGVIGSIGGIIASVATGEAVLLIVLIVFLPLIPFILGLKPLYPYYLTYKHKKMQKATKPTTIFKAALFGTIGGIGVIGSIIVIITSVTTGEAVPLILLIVFLPLILGFKNFYSWYKLKGGFVGRYRYEVSSQKMKESYQYKIKKEFIENPNFTDDKKFKVLKIHWWMTEEKLNLHYEKIDLLIECKNLSVDPKLILDLSTKDNDEVKQWLSDQKSKERQKAKELKEKELSLAMIEGSKIANSYKVGKICIEMSKQLVSILLGPAYERKENITKTVTKESYKYGPNGTNRRGNPIYKMEVSFEDGKCSGWKDL